ncbi:DUF736 domain-containing protein [Thermogemmatispora carboxidivorans]|uniref:DUF736 domain-containing protein n=1 Tax=Thermogemmatispora carboxidivorans TaxID=1382306 RepID=UPI00138E445C|nr:DUF736 domain-containing protein [Thermogemmatispora carboxidivorans]
MMIIGNFRKVGGDYVGKVETLLFTIQAALEAVSSKPSDKSPDFRVLTGDREIGAAWKKTSKDGKEFLSVLIEDPTISINCALFETEAGNHVLTYSRERN